MIKLEYKIFHIRLFMYTRVFWTESLGEEFSRTTYVELRGLALEQIA